MFEKHMLLSSASEYFDRTEQHSEISNLTIFPAYESHFCDDACKVWICKRSTGQIQVPCMELHIS